MQPRILVVEDEGIVSLDIEEGLEKAGYLVTSVVDNAKDAISATELEKPDLILMDIVLRGQMDGIEAATQIQDRYGVPVVYLTAHADESTLRRARVTTPYGYIVKPFDHVDLKPAIELALDRYRQEGKTKEVNAPIKRKKELFRPNSNENSTAEQLFSEISPLKDFDSDTRNLLAKSSKLRIFQEGENVTFEGDIHSPAFVVVLGRVVLLKCSNNGKELIVDFVPPGDTFPLSIALDNARCPYTAKTHIKSKILMIPRNALALALEELPELYKVLSEEVASRLRDSFDMTRGMAHDRVEVRIATALLALRARLNIVSSQAEEEYVLELTRKELADLTGTTPETSSRVSKSLEREGILDLTQAGIIIVCKPKELERLLNV